MGVTRGRQDWMSEGSGSGAGRASPDTTANRGTEGQGGTRVTGRVWEKEHHGVCCSDSTCSERGVGRGTMLVVFVKLGT